MSTLSEIAMNHAKMLKGMAEKTLELQARQPMVVGGFDVTSIEAPQHMPLHFLVDVQERTNDLIGATA